MSEYTTDEEKVEAIKKWWQENGKAVIAGIVLGVGGLFGWRYWVDLNETRAERASDLFLAVDRASRAGDLEQARQQADLLRADYARTPYAPLAALELARLQAARGELDSAEENLHWAIGQGRSEEVTWTARVRLARVLVALERADEALETVAGSHPQGFEALVEEVRGDAWRAKGDRDQARAAYDRAIAASMGGTEFLQMKRDDVAVPGA